jgi:hypothetical protein
MKDGQKQPEFNAEYIDSLLSMGTPKMEAEKAPPAVQEPVPVPGKRSRKAIVILAAIIAVTVVLCLLPDLLAKLQADLWQTRCQEAYSDLVVQNAYHYRLRESSKESQDQKAEVLESECWDYRKDRLKITYNTPTDKTYSLYRNGHHYIREVTDEDPNAEWIYKADVLSESISTPRTLEEGGYTYESVSASFTGTKVTYAWEYQPPAGGDGVLHATKRMTFHFDAHGELVGLVVESESGNGSWYQYLCLEYTFLSTDKKQINDTIRQCYKEATGE